MLRLNIKRICDVIGSVTVLLITLYIIFFLSDEISKYTLRGIMLCLHSIVGAVFPFMVLTDFMLSHMDFREVGLIRRSFEKAFNINGNAIIAFIAGSLCGYTVGVKVGTKLYNCNAITRDEFERIIAFSNNASPAYVIMGIGYGMRGNASEGAILYLSMLISSLSVAVVMNRKCRKSELLSLFQAPEFDFVTSVKNAAAATIQISAFIVFFSSIIGVVDSLVESYIIKAFLITFLEVGNAAQVLSTEVHLSRFFSLILTSFAISFSGICVHMQTRSIINSEDISMKRYYVCKLLQGVLSAAITAFFVLIKNTVQPF